MVENPCQPRLTSIRRTSKVVTDSATVVVFTQKLLRPKRLFLAGPKAQAESEDLSTDTPTKPLMHSLS